METCSGTGKQESTMNHVKRNLHAMIEDAQRLLEHVPDDASEDAADARKRLQQSIEDAKERLREARRNAHHARRHLERRLHQDPWPAIACSFTIGLLTGLILGAHHR